MLKPYESSDFDLLTSWVTDEEILLQFAGTDFSYPLSRAQIKAYQAAHPERRFYIGYTNDEVAFAFGEIIPQENGKPRLARILVGQPALRGKGLGQYFIRLLLEEIREHYPTPAVELFAWEKNDEAIKCYTSVGFKFCPDRAMTMVHKNINYHIHKMTYTFSEENCEAVVQKR
ncbi:GNAT family N-acetyltransferase [Pedobacter sp. N36a]|uniref:GNAT family N-acetyltransferase n=1 Tax=Pedobacter sp. N36a TaxID=2767996 RepID=UPI001656DB10|nr:GNAT family N-acetyltransferase [Pedobacter sp. N36a]MBC8987729.1 GNAT family N-acetyltransferase [Pedobacter sp. N36a]